MKKRVLALSMAALMAGSLLVGCGSKQEEVSTSTKAEESKTEAVETTEESKEETAAETSTDGGKTLIIGTGQTCSSLDPINSYDGWYSIRFGICQTLTRMNDDLTISGWLADDYGPNEDNTVWTFTIKDGVTFSNGNPCTAEAVKGSLENLFENGTRGTEYFTPVSIEADGQVLTITCEHPEPILPNKLADPIFSVQDCSGDMSNILEEGPVGTGPFLVDSFDDSTKECTVVKNPNYWGSDVKVDKVTFVYTEDQAALTWGLQGDTFDAVYNISMTEVENFEQDDNYNVLKTASGRTAHGFMNQNGVLGDDNLRHAIMMALDKETFCQTLLNGQYVPGKTLLTSASKYGYDELVDPYAYDWDAAEKLLNDSGYEDIDGDGFRETPDGQPLDINFVYYTGRPEQQVMVEATQMELAKLGIKVSPNVQETSIVIDWLSAGNFDMLCMSINALNCADPENHLNSYFKTGGSSANYGWSNPDFDALLDELSVTADADKRIEIVKEAEQILLDDAVVIPFCYPIMNFVTKANVSGIKSTPADYYWISEETSIN